MLTPEMSDRWQSIQLARVAAGNLTPDCADNTRIALAHFVGWIGDNAEASSIDAERLEGFYVWCLGQEWSVVYARKVFSASRVFIRWLWESNLIELPRNIDSRSFRFGSGAKKIPVWETGEVISVIDAAPGHLKLHLLLMLNCGFTQQDISELGFVATQTERLRGEKSAGDGGASVPGVKPAVRDDVSSSSRSCRSAACKRGHSLSPKTERPGDEIPQEKAA